MWRNRRKSSSDLLTLNVLQRYFLFWIFSPLFHFHVTCPSYDKMVLSIFFPLFLQVVHRWLSLLETLRYTELSIRVSHQKISSEEAFGLHLQVASLNHHVDLTCWWKILALTATLHFDVFRGVHTDFTCHLGAHSIHPYSLTILN